VGDDPEIRHSAALYMNMGTPKQLNRENATSIQKRTSVKYRKPGDRGTATYTNIVTMVARPIGIVPLQLVTQQENVQEQRLYWMPQHEQPYFRP
jgi:hypothetical protein